MHEQSIYIAIILCKPADIIYQNIDLNLKCYHPLSLIGNKSQQVKEQNSKEHPRANEDGEAGTVMLFLQDGIYCMHVHVYI